MQRLFFWSYLLKRLIFIHTLALLVFRVLNGAKPEHFLSIVAFRDWLHHALRQSVNQIQGS
jgi:hypothetical protein